MATTVAGTVGTGRHEILTVGKGLLGEGVGKQLALFLAAPFIGLAYIVVAPLVGTAVMVKLAIAPRS